MRCSQKKAEKKVHIKQSNPKKRSKKYPSYRQFVHEIITTKDMVLRGGAGARGSGPAMLLPCSGLASPPYNRLRAPTLLPPPSHTHTHITASFCFFVTFAPSPSSCFFCSFFVVVVGGGGGGCTRRQHGQHHGAAAAAAETYGVMHVGGAVVAACCGFDELCV